MRISSDLVGTAFAPTAREWTRRDCALYALAIGAGQQDPGEELEFTTHLSGGRPQRVYPIFGALAGGEAGVGGLLALLGGAVDTRLMLHGEQRFEQFTELPAQASVITAAHISAVWDKGSAAVIETVADTCDATTGEPYCRSTQSMFFRGSGGWGGDRGPSSPAAPTPDAEPERVLVARTRHDQALLYRLCGDENPLHVDPEVARAAGYDRPILHGMCTYGIVGRLLLHSYADDDPARFGSISARFSRPLLPGEQVVVETWPDGQNVRFVAKNDAAEIVLSNGRFELVGEGDSRA